MILDRRLSGRLVLCAAACCVALPVSAEVEGSGDVRPLARIVGAAGSPSSGAVAAARAASREPRISVAPCPTPTTELAERFERFLEDVAVLMTSEERQRFLCLTRDHQRDAFVREFWRVRDDFPDTPRNEFQIRFEERLLAVRQLYDDLEDVRARLFLLHGPPSLRVPICPPKSRTRIEAWFWGFEGLGDLYATLAEGRLRRGQFAAVFYVAWGGRTWRTWVPGERLQAEDPLDIAGELPAGDEPAEARRAATPSPGPRSSPRSLGAGCEEEILEAALQVIALLDSGGTAHYERMLADRLAGPPPPSGEWVATFASYSTDRPAGATRLDADVAVGFPGSRGARTVVQILVSIPAEQATPVDALGYRGFAFELIGEVLRADPASGDDVLFEAFRYRFTPTADLGDHHAPLRLVAQRLLRPGDYRLVLRLDDLGSDAVHTEELELWVPAAPALADRSPERGAGGPDAPAWLDEANRRLASGEPELSLIVPNRDLLSGYARFEAVATGPIATVTFFLDGNPVLTKRAPPWSVELDLGRLPTARTLRVVGHDAEGNEIASDVELINGSPHRFAVRLLDPPPGSVGLGSARVRADVVVPSGRSLDRVELYRDDQLVATLYQPPFVHPVELADADLAVIRAVAYTAGGTRAEDTLIVNAPPGLEQLQIDLVELYTTVTDRFGRPVLGLEADDFTIREDGELQVLGRFEIVDDSPLTGAILLDVSASMKPRLERAVGAATRFLADVVRARDLFSVVVFNDRPRVAAPPTADLARLGRGLVGLRPERGTALYDSLVFTLHQLNGLPGQRVVLLLSDGADEHSAFSFEETLESARRAGVTLYAIGIDLPRGGGPEGPRRTLERLAEETGGREFFVDDLDELDSIYGAIAQELRTRYLLAYQSSNTDAGSGFRRVAVSSRGGRARTIRGYYP